MKEGISSTVRVVFLSGQSLLREMMEQVAALAGDIELVASAGQLSEIPKPHELNPDVVVADLNPALFGLKLGQDVANIWPRVPLIALSSHCDEAAIRQLQLVGFENCLSKDVGLDQLFQNIRTMAARRPSLTTSSLASRAPNSEPHRTVRLLTRRETEVLDMIARGFANKQVAATLQISPKTVEKHRQSVMKKLAVHETAGLTRCAFSLGLGFGEQFEASRESTVAVPFLQRPAGARGTYSSVA